MPTGKSLDVAVINLHFVLGEQFEKAPMALFTREFFQLCIVHAGDLGQRRLAGANGAIDL